VFTVCAPRGRAERRAVRSVRRDAPDPGQWADQQAGYPRRTGACHRCGVWL